MLRQFYPIVRFYRKMENMILEQTVCSINFRYMCMESSPLKIKGKPFSKLEEFNSSFGLIHNDAVHDLQVHLPVVSERIKKVMEYNTLGGKKVRGLLVPMSLKLLSDNKMTFDLKSAFILGWCVELLQAFFIVADDLMDHGLTRRGKTCWYRLSNVGLQAVNDALILERCVSKLLRMYFSNEEYYIKICDEFDKATEITVWGQALDMACFSEEKPNLEVFNLDRYWKIIEYKTAYYTFCLPVFLAMHVIGRFKEEHFLSVKNICDKIGQLFQIQDDFLDIYGNSEFIGKVGTDIQEGKCNWFAATVMENCSDTEKKLMQEYYGVRNSFATKEILKLFDSLHLKDKYLNVEQQLHNDIILLITALDERALNKDLFFGILESIYRRQK